jgi:hypothetical protein
MGIGALATSETTFCHARLNRGEIATHVHPQEFP